MKDYLKQAKESKTPTDRLLELKPPSETHQTDTALLTANLTQV